MHADSRVAVLLNVGQASHPVRLFGQLMNFYVAISDSALIALRDATIKRRMPIYKPTFLSTTSRWAAKCEIRVQMEGSDE